jgi:hypothetical protein
VRGGGGGGNGGGGNGGGGDNGGDGNGGGGNGGGGNGGEGGGGQSPPPAPVPVGLSIRFSNIVFPDDPSLYNSVLPLSSSDYPVRGLLADTLKY